MLGNEGKRRGRQRIRRLDSIRDSMDMNLNRLQKMVEDRGAWLGYNLATEQQQQQMINMLRVLIEKANNMQK